MEESASFATEENRTILVHLTIQEDHQKYFEVQFNKVKETLENKFRVNYELTFSFQNPQTNTIALDEKGEVYKKNGKPFLRPGGHGALLENLQQLKADLVIIKNIDNVSHKSRMDISIRVQKMLVAYLLSLQEQLFDVLENWDRVNPEEARIFMETHFDIHPISKAFSKDDCFDILNRPVRICGMVRNSGELGGGPFSVALNNNMIGPQIIESSQIKREDVKQMARLRRSTHFNPVMMVCGLKNYKGEQFDLQVFSSPEMYMVPIKSHQGKKIKVLELPGLWNGGMAYWNTVFIEVPIEVFNPVKTLADLLRPAHQL